MIDFAGHIPDDWVPTKYSDKNLLGFCLSRCPAGKACLYQTTNCKYRKYKRILKYIISGYIHPLLGLLADTLVQPDGDRKYRFFGVRVVILKHQLFLCKLLIIRCVCSGALPRVGPLAGLGPRWDISCPGELKTNFYFEIF